MTSKLALIAAPALAFFAATPLAAPNELPSKTHDDKVVMFVQNEDMAWAEWYKNIESDELTAEPVCLYEGYGFQPENVFGMRYMIAECNTPAFYPEITPKD